MLIPKYKEPTLLYEGATSVHDRQLRRLQGKEPKDEKAGFWIEENVLSKQECVELIDAMSQNQERRGRAGARHLMSNPAVAAVANSPRLLQIAKRALKKEAVPYRATLFEKSVA